MKQSLLSKVGIPLVILLLAIAGASVMVMSKQPPEKKEVKELPLLVDVEPVFYNDIGFTVSAQGNVSAKNQTTIAAQVSGKVVSIADNFVAGGFFRKGDILVSLEKEDFQTDVMLAEAELAQAEASLQEELARGKVAEQEWRSVNSVVPPELGLRKPQLAKEQANVKAAQAKLARAKRNLDRTNITAPYDGIVRTRNVDLGQFVSPGAAIGDVNATDVAEIRLPLTDADVAVLNLNDPATGQLQVELQAVVGGKVQQWMAKLVRTEGVLDTSNRLIYAIAEVFDPYLRDTQSSNVAILRFGQFVSALIKGSGSESLIELPRNVIRLDNTVLTANDDNEVEIRDVNVVRSDENSVFISSGLRNGDRVITSAIPNPSNGLKIRISGTDLAEQDKPQDSSKLDTTQGDS